MKEEKIITRISLTYFPPTLKFEFTKGTRRTKYHKIVSMEKHFTDFSSATERSVDTPSIVKALTLKHDELNQVPDLMMIRIIEKLFSSCTTNKATNPDADASLDFMEPPGLRVNMNIERGNLTFSPMKCLKKTLELTRIETAFRLANVSEQNVESDFVIADE